MKTYLWKEVSFLDNKFLSPIFVLLEGEDIKVWAYLPNDPVAEKLRISFDGVWTLKIGTGKESFGVLYSDFKILGGSFGIKTSERIIDFLGELSNSSTPLLACFNTIGVRIMEGRKVFHSSFKIVPALLKFAESNLLITANMGKCLGLGALLYAIGDYQMAVNSKALINLTGPEVFKMFFGTNIDFEASFNSKEIQSKTTMVHEVFDSPTEMLFKALSIIKLDLASSICLTSNPDTADIIETISDKQIELFPQLKCSVESYIASKDGRNYGVLINPLGKANMIDVDTIEKYRISLKVFKKFKLPVMSFVDTPGADPRKEQTESDLIIKLAGLTEDIINYPFRKIGLIMNRCYGGASILAFPTFYGGEKAWALKGSNMNIMGKNIILHLLSSSERLLSMYKENSKNETEDDISDFIELGMFEGFIEKSELSEKVTSFLTPVFDFVTEENILEDLRKENPLGFSRDNKKEDSEWKRT